MSTQTVIHKKIEVDLSAEQSFNAFIGRLALWWPKEYTWAKDKLTEISIHPVPGGHCTEKGPNDFRCDWGTVVATKHGEFITFKWQISPFRAPEPNPLKASEVTVRFRTNGAHTVIDLRHDHFENHGEGYEAYYEAMDSAQGWDFILACFKKHAENGVGTNVEVKH